MINDMSDIFEHDEHNLDDDICVIDRENIKSFL